MKRNPIMGKVIHRQMRNARAGSATGRGAGKSPAVVPVFLTLLAVLLSCDNPTESKNTKGSIQGFLMDTRTAQAVHRPAWVFNGDKLLASADPTGAFEIASLLPGEYTLTGSALNHRDTVLTVLVLAGKAARADFWLDPDASENRVIGEFQNNVLFRDSLAVHPEMAGWDAKEVYDAATGATIQGKEPLLDYHERQVFVGDSLLDVSDNWGQYSFRLRGSTVPLRGSCEGYRDTLIVAKLSPAGRIVVNFFLEPEISTP